MEIGVQTVYLWARTHVSKIGRFPPSIFFWSSIWMLVVGYADIRYSRS